MARQIVHHGHQGHDSGFASLVQSLVNPSQLTIDLDHRAGTQVAGFADDVSTAADDPLIPFAATTSGPGDQALQGRQGRYLGRQKLKRTSA